MFKCCIFDMDGTLSDTIESIAYFGNKALAEIGLPPIDTETYKLLVGNGAELLIHRALDHYGCDTTENFNIVFPKYKADYDADFMYLTKPYDGIMEVLTELKALGIKTAILSNKPHSTAQKVSDIMFGDKLIDICRGETPEVPIKPDPKGLFLLLEKFGCTPEECIYVGDTGTDVETGKAAGAFTVGVLWGFRKKPELLAADAIISHPLELLTFID
ncbi:MAG: HAD family hydrolase [Oscillospiraceae bacterium]|nr:HAD family hydrolase [Oscillospiraceae bacterium]